MSGCVSSKWAKGTGGPSGDEAYNLVAYRKSKRAQSVTDDKSWVATLWSQGSSVNASGPTVMLQPVAFDARQSDVIQYGDISGPLDTDGQTIGVACINMQGSKSNACVSTDGSSYSLNSMHGHDVHAVVSPSLTATNDPSRSPQSSEVTEQVSAVFSSTATVRRLTPRECERLQGFPDDWTAIPWRGRAAEDCPDGPRYRALGNSMAVNCMEWIGERIGGSR